MPCDSWGGRPTVRLPDGTRERIIRENLARYTHRVAISNQRLVRLEGEQVTFTWKD